VSTGGCHSGGVSFQVVFLTSMDRIDRIFGCGDFWIPAFAGMTGRGAWNDMLGRRAVICDFEKALVTATVRV